MKELIIYSHATAGGFVLLLGLINFINKKGSRNHILIGRVYVGLMWWICLSALLSLIFIRFNLFLLVIAVFTFHMSFVGIRVLYRKTPGTQKWHDWLVSIMTLLFGLGLSWVMESMRLSWRMLKQLGRFFLYSVFSLL